MMQTRPIAIAIASHRRSHVSWTLGIFCTYLLAAVGVWLGLWGNHWAAMSADMWSAPSATHWLGTNRLGQDILQRALASTATAFEVGLIVAVASTALGTVVGAIGGHFSQSWLDEIILWITGTLEAIPFYLFVVAVAFALRGHPLAMHLAMITTFWTATARLVRAETMRIGQEGFIEAARATGTRPSRIIARHLVPNLSHVILVQATLAFVAAIKAEVVLSFLGIGIQDSISWGVMMAEAGQDILAGRYMNFLAASVFLFGLVMATSLLADRLQDALDPRARQLGNLVPEQRQE